MSDPNTPFTPLATRLDHLEHRIARLEQAVRQWTGITPDEPTSTTAPPAGAPPAQSVAAQPVHRPAEIALEAESPAPVSPVLPPPLPPQQFPTLTASRPAKLDILAEVTASHRPADSAPGSSAPTPSAEHDSLEAMIGRNWTSWVGAIVVVIGVMFFLKYAWDQGWLKMPPTARVLCSIVLGGLFLGAGEWLHRKTMRVLAATLCGAGIAVIMAAFFAAASLFDPPVFSKPVAYIGVGAAAVIGILMALRINALTLAIIALLGEYIAPIILGSHKDQSLALMLYLGVLAMVGWALAYLKPRWWGLRYFTWGCTAIWMAIWFLNFGLRAEHRALAILSVMFFYMGFLGESFASLHRAFRIRNPENESAVPHHALLLDQSLAALSIFSTAATFGAIYAVLNPVAPIPKGWLSLHPSVAFAIGLACIHAVTAFATPAKQFMRSSLLQAAGLITLAVPLALNQHAITLSWFILAITLAGLAWRINNLPVKIWSIVLLGLGLVRLCAIDAFETQLTATWIEIAQQPVSRWLLMAIATAALYHGIGWIMATRPRAPDQPNLEGVPPLPLLHQSTVGTVLSSIGSALFLIATASCWTGAPLTVLWILWTAVLLALARPGRAIAYPAHAAMVLVLVTAKWLIIDGLMPIAFDWGNPAAAGQPILNMTLLNGILLIALYLWIATDFGATFLSLKPTNSSAGALPTLPLELKPFAIAVAAGIGFFILNFETLRTMDWLAASFADPATAKQVALSVLWAIVGLSCVIVGFARNLPVLRYVALGLLGLTLFKIFTVDMAKVQAVYRILSFLAVGGLLLGVSFVYHKQVKRT